MGYDQRQGLLDYCGQVEAGPYEDIWGHRPPARFQGRVRRLLDRLAGGPLAAAGVTSRVEIGDGGASTAAVIR